MQARRKMNLAAFSFPPGMHTAGWRHPEAAPGADTEFRYYAHLATAAERAKIDMVFFQDTVAVSQSNDLSTNRETRARFARCVNLEPSSVLPALAVVTERIGLVATATTTYNEPYHVARRFATIDQISGGRAGWNLVTSQMEDEAWNFGLEKHVDHSLRYERAEEFHDVVVGLWDSWEDGALLRDKSSGVYFDPDKLHLLRHEGRFFSVRGPLNVPRSPQGRPVVAQAGSSGPGKELASRTAEVIFTAQTDLNDALRFSNDVRRRAEDYGRLPDDIRILPGIVPIVGRTDAEAEEKFEYLQSLVTDDVGLLSLQRLAGGLDLSKFPLDGPLPDLPPSNSARARQQILIALGKKGMTIRQLGRLMATASTHRHVVGKPETIADHMEQWFTAGAADGFTVLFPYLPGPVEEFTTLVVPELQRRSLFRTEYEGRTLREHLGLARPANRHARGSSAAAAE